MLRFPLPAAAVAAALLLNGCGGRGDQAVGTVPIGDKAEVGHLVYTAFETQWLTQIPQQPTARIPQHRFFLIRMSARNTSNISVMMPNLSIEDDQGRIYKELNAGEGISQWMGYLRQVKPSENMQGYVVFDAPPAHYKMRVADESDDRFALIDIPLNYGGEAGAPVVPIPGEKQ